jgi:recombination protein RecA
MKSSLDSFFKSFSDTEDLMDARVASAVSNIKLPVIHSGSHVLDDALSSGGLPKGRLIQFYGPPGSGKSLMAMIAIHNAQIDDPEAMQVFIDAEQTFDVSWAKKLGININKVWVVDGDLAVNGRRCFEMLLGVPKEDAKHVLKGKSKEGLLDKIASKAENINLIILDSLGAIIPPGEDTSAIGKMNMSLMARFLSTTFKKLSLEVKKANVPFIVINHKRDNMGMYGPDHTFSGGNSYGHFLSANIYFEGVQRKDEMILDANENKIGGKIRATVEKSKFGPWPRKCEFKVMFATGVINLHEEILDLAIQYGIVERPTTVSYTYKDQTWRGRAATEEALLADESLQQELLAVIEEARMKHSEEQVEDSKIVEEPSFEEELEKAKKKSKKHE